MSGGSESSTYLEKRVKTVAVLAQLSELPSLVGNCRSAANFEGCGTAKDRKDRKHGRAAR
jgi:hypothetical protein